jgi:hypothetical protein
MNLISEESVSAFASLYRGRTDAWGGVGGVCFRQPVTIANYRNHLEGKVSLGIYPLLDDGTCHFLDIDIDFKDISAAAKIREKLWALEIPAYISASRSKGYHISIFAFDHFIAKDIRVVCARIIEDLQIKAELFPKQDRLEKTTPFGNYINLPSCGSARPFLTADNKVVPLEQALDLIKVTPIECVMKAVQILIPHGTATPSSGKSSVNRSLEIDNIFTSTLAVGERRPMLIKIAGYLRHHGITEQAAVALTLPWAAQHFTELLPPAEIEKHIRGIYRRYGVNNISGIYGSKPHALATIYPRTKGKRSSK